MRIGRECTYPAPLRPGGTSVTVALADLVASTWLVAVMVTDCSFVMVAGAVYTPLAVRVPKPLGLNVHVTAPTQSPVTVAANCCVWELSRPMATGLTVTPIWFSA